MSVSGIMVMKCHELWPQIPTFLTALVFHIGEAEQKSSLPCSNKTFFVRIPLGYIFFNFFGGLDHAMPVLCHETQQRCHVFCTERH